ncbi:hypothetical protein BMF35_a0741 [Aurantiacibacter gangjinensis]|uniref:Uncharacterized protein n=1 Tax=Aurantiacibacter gangjinensis TaxID=502682 RepID=A0A0G9MSB5_9SPHN|nr:hypothetical protein BMF35_a0741 [Aurantiacibacter gangjinensis]KLE32208.1 hypothetical protein AAW01_08675 [Aurantiacibacter gangjinensis]
MLVLIGVAAVWYYAEPIRGYSQTATAYAAKNACSCRHIGGRALDSCKDDLLPGMGLVFLGEDEAQQSVTARIPLVASTTAQHREGFGCVLEPWES